MLFLFTLLIFCLNVPSSHVAVSEFQKYCYVLSLDVNFEKSDVKAPRARLIPSLRHLYRKSDGRCELSSADSCSQVRSLFLVFLLRNTWYATSSSAKCPHGVYATGQESEGMIQRQIPKEAITQSKELYGDLSLRTSAY